MEKILVGLRFLVNNISLVFMSQFLLVITMLFLFKDNPSYAQEIALVVHGGAGNIYKKDIPDSLELEYRKKLEDVLISGFKILLEDGTSLEAVRQAIKVMEDSPLFNAGKGAVFTNTGTNEMDASIMEGASLNAGAVAGVKHIKNPIDAAIAVMNHSPHVLLAGDGAEIFAKSQGIELVDAKYFYTEGRYRQLQRIKERNSNVEGYIIDLDKSNKFGTVGAVALDKYGNIVAGTSTGGMTNKKFGRIGDSPIIGAGTFANNKTCGISATGHGEYFIRSVVAHDISALMEYKNLTLQEAAEYVILEKLSTLGGEGGIIGLDIKGNVVMSFNSNGMFRGFIKQKGDPQIFIFKE